MLIAAVSTIAKLWKEPKCPLTDEWVKNKWYVYVTYTHNGILLSHQQNRSLAICINIVGARVYYSKRNKSEKDKYHMISLLCNLRKKRDEHREREEKIK